MPNGLAYYYTGEVYFRDTRYADEWYVGIYNGNYYFYSSSAYSDKSLCFSGTTVSASNMATAADNNKWSVTRFGIDVPCIKQCTSYFCGPAAVLQALYGARYDCSIVGNNLVAQMDTIAVDEMGMSPSYNQNTNDSASYVDIYSSLNNYLGLTDSNNQYKPRWPGTSSTIALN